MDVGRPSLRRSWRLSQRRARLTCSTPCGQRFAPGVADREPARCPKSPGGGGRQRCATGPTGSRPCSPAAWLPGLAVSPGWSLGWVTRLPQMPRRVWTARSQTPWPGGPGSAGIREAGSCPCDKVMLLGPLFLLSLSQPRGWAGPVSSGCLLWAQGEALPSPKWELGRGPPGPAALGGYLGIIGCVGSTSSSALKGDFPPNPAFRVDPSVGRGSVSAKGTRAPCILQPCQFHDRILDP